MALHVVGVRHHSPACARLVAHTIRELRPRHVLIEGPVDMTDRIDELALPHTLPVAIFSYRTRVEGGASTGTSASWSPLCDYSPEWVAVQKAREVGAQCAFIDLPAWHDAFSGVRNRYSDRHALNRPRTDRYGARTEALCARLQVEDVDALWDHLFEQPREVDELRSALRAYFRGLREGAREGEWEPGGDRDEPREAYMARWIAWAMSDALPHDQHVVVVCGGYHAPVLEERWQTSLSTKPEVPSTGAPDDRVGSYLVPYSFHRLDSFVGYESGMPSPSFYQESWERGAERAGETMMFRAITWLRNKKQRVSPADAIAASTSAHGLCALRGHRALSRIDVLDGIASAVVKDALDAPLPWNRRGRILSRTDPMLVELVAAFSGDRVGQLAKGTPRPPLVDDAFVQVERVGIELGRTPKAVKLSIAEPDGRDRSRVFHRLRLLGIPGFTRTRALSWKRGSGELEETWTVQRALDADAALIEASAYGESLETAAIGKLEEQIGCAPNLAVLAALLMEAALVGVPQVTERVLGAVRKTAWAEPSFAVLGAALGNILGLWKYDVLLGTAGSKDLAAVMEAAFDRGLWLFEGIDGENAPADSGHVRAVIALRDVLREATTLSIDTARAHAVMDRRVMSRHAPPALRGAALGFLWSTGAYADAAASEARAVASLRAAARPEILGDYLVGLFALSREEVTSARTLLAAIDSVLRDLEQRDFFIAVPSLRLAFSFFPPQEKERIARGVLALHDGDQIDARSMVRPAISPQVTLRGMKLEADVEAFARRYGLHDDSEHTK